MPRPPGGLWSGAPRTRGAGPAAVLAQVPECRGPIPAPKGCSSQARVRPPWWQREGADTAPSVAPQNLEPARWMRVVWSGRQSATSTVEEVGPCVWMRDGLTWRPISHRQTGDCAWQGRRCLGEGRCVHVAPHGKTQQRRSPGQAAIGPGGWRQSRGRHPGARFLQLVPQKGSRTVGPALGAGRQEPAWATRAVSVRWALGEPQCLGGWLRSAPPCPPGPLPGPGPRAAGHPVGPAVSVGAACLWESFEP